MEFTKKEIEFLLNLLKRKQFACEYVTQNPHKFKPEARMRAAKALDLIKSLTIKLKDMAKIAEKEGFSEIGISFSNNLEKRIRDLELKIDQLEVIVKKLVAYHKGEI